ncbi:MAG: aminopeptidase, partial [Chitinophagaceae bacterium]
KYTSATLAALVLAGSAAHAQTEIQLPGFLAVKVVKATPVKNQEMTGTCWSFSATSMLESQALAGPAGEVDLSEMFTVRNIYIEKAHNYILRLGKAQFSEGGLGHDPVRATELYGAMPESAYKGLTAGQKGYDHQKMFKQLERYVDSVVKAGPVKGAWLPGYTAILDGWMGAPPAEFTYAGKKYTPKTFATEVLRFSSKDFVNLTSFSHRPYYTPYAVEVPDNFSNGHYYNLPLSELTEAVKTAVGNGYSITWDADVSNNGFRQEQGLALFLDAKKKYKPEEITPETTEAPANEAIRQQLYESLVTQDDHLMHIVGVEKSRDGRTFFLVKNSWGPIGPYKGYILVSEAYFNINTISLVLPKAALTPELQAKLKL